MEHTEDHPVSEIEGESRGAEFIVPVGGSHVQGLTAHTTQQLGRRGWRKNRLTRKSWILVLRRTVNDFLLDGYMDRAAVLTFFMLLTFAPTVLAGYSIATLVLARNEDQVSMLVNDLIQTYVPPEIQGELSGIVEVIIGSSAEGTLALLLSVGIGLFSSSAWVRAFARSANSIYGRVEGRTILVTFLTMWGITLTIVLGSVVIILAPFLQESTVTLLLEPIAGPLGIEEHVQFLVGMVLPIWQWLRFPVIVFLSNLLIVFLYCFAPNVRPAAFRLCTTGSVLALVVIGLVWWVFGLYLARFAGASAYGAIGTIIAVLFVLWAMNIAFILGIKVDAEILRAKELQAGMDSERVIQAFPRSSKAAHQYSSVQRELENLAIEIKEAE